MNEAPRSNPSQRRTQFAMVILLLGLILVLWSWASWMYRTSAAAAPGTSSPSAGHDPHQAVQAARSLSQLMLVGLILALLVLFGGYLIIRAARRYRASTDRARLTSTAAEDVWLLHKLPDVEDDDE